MSGSASKQEAPVIKGVPNTFFDPKAPKVLKLGNETLDYVASAPANNDPRLVSDYYKKPEPRIVTARVLNKDTGVFEMRAVGASTYHKKHRKL